jgi:hypothetical protein
MPVRVPEPWARGGIIAFLQKQGGPERRTIRWRLDSATLLQSSYRMRFEGSTGCQGAKVRQDRAVFGPGEPDRSVGVVGLSFSSP